MEAIAGRTAHRLFMTICQFPAMRASWLREIVGGSSGEVSRHLKRFVDTGLVAVFDGRHYLSELGMRRAANMSRVLPAVIRSRHGAYLDRWYREHEQHHHDGVNRLVVRFAREGVEVVAVFVTNLNLTTYCYEHRAGGRVDAVCQYSLIQGVEPLQQVVESIVTLHRNYLGNLMFASVSC